LSAAEFEAGLTGVVLTFEPGIHFKLLRNRTQPIWRTYIASMLHAPGAAGLIAQVLGASLCLLFLGLALPLFTKLIVDRVLPRRNVGVMGVLAVGLALTIVSQAVASCLRSVLLLSLRGRLDLRMMLGFFEHLLSLPFRFFQQRNSGDLLMRLGSNTVIRDALTSQSLSAILDGALVVGYLAILGARAPLFCALACSVGCLQIVLLQGTSRRRRELNQRELAAQSESQSYVVEALSGVTALKASGTEDHVGQAFLPGS
jgi:ABC-type bacteriocin/lantibiotic exporter with double-glycine peptidase domain